MGMISRQYMSIWLYMSNHRCICMYIYKQTCLSMYVYIDFSLEIDKQKEPNDHLGKESFPLASTEQDFHHRFTTSLVDKEKLTSWSVQKILWLRLNRLLFSCWKMRPWF